MSRSSLDTTPLGEATPHGMVSGDINGIRYLALADETLREALTLTEIERRTYSAPPLMPARFYCYPDKIARLWLPVYVFPWSTDEVTHERPKGYVFTWPDGYSRFTLKNPGELKPFKGPYADMDAGIMQRNIELVMTIFKRDIQLMLNGTRAKIDEETIQYELMKPPFQTRDPAPALLRLFAGFVSSSIGSPTAREKAVGFRFRLEN